MPEPPLHFPDVFTYALCIHNISRATQIKWRLVYYIPKPLLLARSKLYGRRGAGELWQVLAATEFYSLCPRLSRPFHAQWHVAARANMFLYKQTWKLQQILYESRKIFNIIKTVSKNNNMQNYNQSHVGRQFLLRHPPNQQQRFD